MVKLLIIDDANEYVSFKLITGDTVIENITPGVAKTQVNKHLLQFVRRLVCEGRPIYDFSSHCGQLASHRFKELANSHPRWESVRIDYHIRCYSVHVERHILLRNNHSDDPFLAVAGCKLIAQFGYTFVPHSNFDKFAPFIRFCYEDGVHKALLRRSHIDRGVSHSWASYLKFLILLEESRRTYPAD